MSQMVNIVNVVNQLGAAREDVSLSVPEDSELIELSHGETADIWTCWPVDVTFMDTATEEENCTILIVLGLDGLQFLQVIGADGEYRRRVG